MKSNVRGFNAMRLPPSPLSPPPSIPSLPLSSLPASPLSSMRGNGGAFGESQPGGRITLFRNYFSAFDAKTIRVCVYTRDGTDCELRAYWIQLHIEKHDQKALSAKTLCYFVLKINLILKKNFSSLLRRCWCACWLITRQKIMPY